MAGGRPGSVTSTAPAGRRAEDRAARSLVEHGLDVLLELVDLLSERGALLGRGRAEGLHQPGHRAALASQVLVAQRLQVRVGAGGGRGRRRTGCGGRRWRTRMMCWVPMCRSAGVSVPKCRRPGVRAEVPMPSGSGAELPSASGVLRTAPAPGSDPARARRTRHGVRARATRARPALDLRDELAEGRRIAHGEVGQLLAVEPDAGDLEAVDRTGRR